MFNILSAIIMASGYSKRMGTNKLLLDISGKKVIEHIISLVKSCDFKEVFLVASDLEVIKISSDYKIDIIQNLNPSLGQSQSINLGVSSANPNNNLMFFVADQPMLKKQTVMKLIEKSKINPNKIIVPFCNEKRCNPVIFPKEMRDSLLSLTGDVGGREIIKNNGDLVEKLFFNNPKEFFDLDTINDYNELKKEFY